MIKKLEQAICKLFILIIRGYKLIFSSFFHNACHYDPTCSVYFIDSLKEYGLLKGMVKGIHRILRCHPVKFLGGGFGYDPVIQKKIKYGK